MSKTKNEVIFDEMAIANQNAVAFKVLKVVFVAFTFIPFQLISAPLLNALLSQMTLSVDASSEVIRSYNDAQAFLSTIFTLLLVGGWGTMWSILLFKRVRLWEHFYQFFLVYWLVCLTAFATNLGFFTDMDSDYFVFYNRHYIQVFGTLAIFVVGILVGVLVNRRKGYEILSLSKE